MRNTNFSFRQHKQYHAPADKQEIRKIKFWSLELRIFNVWTMIFASILNLKCFHMLNNNTMHLSKTDKIPQVVYSNCQVLAEIWSSIYVKGFFCTVLFSLREHLQTRGHRRVFEQTGINVVAPSSETTASGLSTTLK